MVTESIEDYLGAIYVLTRKYPVAKTKDIASALRVSPASVSEMLNKMAEQGYIDYEKYRGAKLTERGMGIAKRVRRKHRLLERFLSDVLGLRHEKSHEEACKLEHIISEESMKKICQMVYDPDTYERSKPFPECDDECEIFQSKPSVSLTNLGEGEEATISFLTCNNPGKVRRLISMGLVPGRKVVVEEKLPMNGPFLLRVEGSRVALARDFTDLVHVKR